MYQCYVAMTVALHVLLLSSQLEEWLLCFTLDLQVDHVIATRHGRHGP